MRIYLLALVLAVLSLSPLPARADDDPGLSDGGTIVTSTDGGRNAVAILQTEQGNAPWTLAIMCDSDTRYLLTADAGLAGAGSQLLIARKTYDIPVNAKQPAGVTRYPLKRFIAVRTEDAGVPYCAAQDAH